MLDGPCQAETSVDGTVISSIIGSLVAKRGVGDSDGDTVKGSVVALGLSAYEERVRKEHSTAKYI
jgi:hypothetical protein